MKKIPLLLLLILTFNCLNSQVIKFDRYDNFLKDHVSHRGFVDYKKVIKDMNDLEEIANDFSKITPNASWTESEIKAYWINVYNVNLIKLIAKYYPVKRIDYIGEPFKKEFIPFNGLTISLDYIQHNILRDLNDPRVHFALYSAADSAPEMKNSAMNPNTLDKDLDDMITFFLSDKTKNSFDAGSGKIQISTIFDWYKDEFKESNNLVVFLNKYQNKQLITAGTQINFQEFHWTLPVICPSKQ